MISYYGCRRLVIIFAFAVLTGLGPGGIAQAVTGFVTTYENTETNDKGTHTEITKTYSAPGKWRMEALEGGAIFDLARNVVWYIDNTKRVARRIDLQQMEEMFKMVETQRQAIGQQMAQYKDKMAAGLDKMSPEQRAYMEKMLGSMGTGPYPNLPKPEQTRWAPTGQHQTINGFLCDAYTQERKMTAGIVESNISETLWWTRLPPPQTQDPEFLAIQKELAEFTRRMLERMPETFKAFMKQQQQNADELGFPKGGFIIRTDSIMNLSMSEMPAYAGMAKSSSSHGVSTFQEIRKQDIDPALFEVPAGYRVEEMQMPAIPSKQTGRMGTGTKGKEAPYGE